MNKIYSIFYVIGFSGYAYDDISYHKVATQSYTYVGTGYDASNAVDRNTGTCTRTNSIGLTSIHKTVWLKIDLGGMYSIYSIQIMFKNYGGYEQRQQGRVAGFSLFVSDTTNIQGSTLCYKDGPQLPPLNFTATCIEYGRYVIFYNERLDGFSYPDEYEVVNAYTELCEVIVLGCSQGVYGTNCESLCPINCKEIACHIQDGACFTCKPGWTGMFCDKKCREGWYGENCTQQCSGHCKDNDLCNHVTGQCDRGCDAGWTGYFCEKACDKGYYGKNCSLVCYPNCKTCQHTDGLCTCKAGWMDPSCNTECTRSYGENCRFPCSVHCVNKTCDRFDGRCLVGCLDDNTCDPVSQQYAEPDTEDIACTPWIIAFSIVLVICIIFIIGTITLWRKTIKQNSKNGCNQCGRIPESGEINVPFSDGVSHYQELSVSKEHNTYQTLTLE